MPDVIIELSGKSGLYLHCAVIFIKTEIVQWDPILILFIFPGIGSVSA
jgi:hypothetical protein